MGQHLCGEYARHNAPVDLTDPFQVEHWVEQAAACYGGVDIVYNNAFYTRFGPMPDISIEDWRATIAGELDMPFFVTKYAWPHLVARAVASSSTSPPQRACVRSRCRQ